MATSVGKHTNSGSKEKNATTRKSRFQLRVSALYEETQAGGVSGWAEVKVRKDAEARQRGPGAVGPEFCVVHFSEKNRKEGQQLMFLRSTPKRASGNATNGYFRTLVRTHLRNVSDVVSTRG